ncbi:hypothetical protein [Treponema sp.]|uniref:hypothetical protein n=1 Tax=Treponema sp. TaxID=166 RepID=UPI00298D9EB8|nr:hypothetical protein [Treponema sp.]MCR5613932.1 DUF4352 domain-containing protein [Treponema sp.]
MKKLTILIISIFVIFAHTLSAQITSDTYKDASVSIKFYDRTMYYPENSKENPVYVHITIRNNGNETLRFKLADDRMFSADFNAFNVKNISLEQTPEIIRKRTTNQYVYFREIALETGEEYSFIENVKDYLVFAEPSIYYLELSFYPELYKSKYIELKSNRLTLEIRPSPTAASSNLIPVQSQTVQILKPQPISPDKVVEQTIVARQKSLWDQFFLYLDLETMLKKDSLRKRQYQNASSQECAKMIEDFKAGLMAERIDQDIVAVPEKFQIKKTTYSQTEGKVIVIEWFKNQNFSEKKQYTYYVQQRNGIWQIYDYDVDNLGTE